MILSIILLLLNTIAQWNSPYIIFADALVILLLATFFYQFELKVRYNSWISTGIIYFVLIVSLLSITWWLRQITLYAQVPLSLNRFFNLEGQSLLILQSIAILLVALYLFSHRLMAHIALIGLSKYARLTLLVIAIVFSLPVLWFLNLEFQPLVIILAVFIYIALFDLFIDSQIPGITWFIIWILLFAIFIATLLYQFTPAESFSQRALSLFSSIFLMLVLTVLILYFISRLFRNLRLPLIGKPSLRNRIQIMVVLLTLLTFLIVGIVTVGFFQKNDPNWEQNRLEFTSAIINVYAFLLLMTGAVAIIIANSITQPIVQVRAKLSHLQLGYNERIEWKSQDEIGELISEYNRMIEKLAESTEKLKQSERESAWREMAKQVAHEIKNPLTPMKLSIQYLMHTAKENPQEVLPMLQRVSQTIIEQIEGLTRIAAEFSNFAKMPKPENSKFVLNDAVSSVFNLFADNPEANAILKLQLPELPIIVFTDRDQIIRVLNNLIKNALQAIPNDRIGKVEVILCSYDTYAQIRVHDNGSGIPLDMYDKVFQPNFTTKSSGTGLGLAMCKNIIEMAGGSIDFESEVNKGTAFFIELPLVENTSI